MVLKQWGLGLKILSNISPTSNILNNNMFKTAMFTQGLFLKKTIGNFQILVTLPR
jgi:hypothetical protein